MRGWLVLGSVLIVVGGTVFLRGLSAPKPEAGDPSITAPNPIIPWATGVAVLAGVVLVTIGKRRKA